MVVLGYKIVNSRGSAIFSGCINCQDSCWPRGGRNIVLYSIHRMRVNLCTNLFSDSDERLVCVERERETETETERERTKKEDVSVVLF